MIHACKFNRNVECSKVGHSLSCTICGWNPIEDAKRKAALHERESAIEARRRSSIATLNIRLRGKHNEYTLKQIKKDRGKTHDKG